VEILSNVQLERRRINVEVQNDGGGDHNGRSSGGSLVAEVVLEKRKFCSKKGSVVRSVVQQEKVDLEVTEEQLRGRWFFSSDEPRTEGSSDGH
jgi:hypothetical protein